jgi:hypothetical protein
MATHTKRKRRILRFSIRTLLIVLTIFCVALGWKVERARKQREAVAWVHEMGGSVKYDYEYVDGAYSPKAKPPGPQWLRKQLGRHFFDDVVEAVVLVVGDVTPLSGLTRLERLDVYGSVTDVTPLAELTRLQELDLNGTELCDVTPLSGLTRLQRLDLRGTQVSDVTPLSGLTSLKWLTLGGTQVSDVTPLAGLPSLQWLYLGGTQMSDVTPLSGLTRLRGLHLRGTQVSEVTPLSGLTSLGWLDLRSTQVSEEAVEQLKRGLPECNIIW